MELHVNKVFDDISIVGKVFGFFSSVELPIKLIIDCAIKLGRLKIRIITNVCTRVRHEVFDAVCVTR